MEQHTQGAGRVIKFRGWDGRTMRVKTLWEQFFYDIVWPDDINAEKWELMQFTGLTDKNGKEIYEGDVIRRFMHYGDDHGNAVGEAEEKVSVVKWSEMMGMQGVGFSFFPCDSIRELEVIGNIYENPELIGKYPASFKSEAEQETSEQ